MEYFAELGVEQESALFSALKETVIADGGIPGSFMILSRSLRSSFGGEVTNLIMNSSGIENSIREQLKDAA